MRWVFSLCSAFFACKHFNSPLISKERGREEKKGSDDVNKTGKGERISALFATFLLFFIIYYHHCGSSLCVPKQITAIQLEASHLSSLARWPECINPVSVRTAALHLSCLIHVAAAITVSVYPLATLTESISVGKLAWQRSDVVTRIYGERNVNSEY